MTRVLIVANQTLGGSELLEAVRRRMREAPCRFTLLVPAGVPPTLQGMSEMGIGAPYRSLAADPEVTAAHERLEHGLASLRGMGATAEGCVVPPDPVRAVREMVGHQEFDEIIISTLPAGISRWLHLAVPHRVEKACHLSVTVITAQRSPAHR